MPSLGKWYLVVGYIYDSSFGGSTLEAGIFEEGTGNRVGDVDNEGFKFMTSTKKLSLRSYLLFTDDPDDRQYYYAPRIEEVNGSEPTIAQLVSGELPDLVSGTSLWNPNGSAIFYTKGNVGIGTNIPEERLVVGGNARITGVRDTDGVIFSIGEKETQPGARFANFNWNRSTGLRDETTRYISHVVKDQNGSLRKTESFESAGETRIKYYGKDNSLLFLEDNVNDEDDYVDRPTLTLPEQNAKLVIGMTNYESSYSLDVNGDIHAKEVTVDLDGFPAPDYVFYKDYNLKTLQEVQKFINKEGHLPNIPSANEMEEKGVNIKEFNLKLLEKIEELTLYTISQEEKLRQQEGTNKILENRLQKLEELLLK